MQDSNIPGKFALVWASSAGAGYILPIPTNANPALGEAGLDLGFPPLNFTAIAAGGIPPFGQYMNGILNQVTAWLQWAQAGAPVKWDSAFSAEIGGYPNGAIVQAAVGGANWWQSTVDNNLTDPDTGGSGWAAVSPGISETLANSLYGQLAAANNWSGPNSGNIVPVAFSSTITIDLSLGNHFKITGISSNFVLANFINVPSGKCQTGKIEWWQNATGGHIITAYGNKFVGINLNKPNLTGGSNGSDEWFYDTRSDGSVLITAANNIG